jgi:hypothetical protein
MKCFRLAAVVVTISLVPAALAACGGDDDSEEEDQITEVIETAATSGSPSVCAELQTQRWNEQLEGQTGEAALESCRENAGDPADSVEVSNIEVDGDAATAEVAVTGSFLDGSTIDVGLVREGEQWKLDQLTGFVEFDRAGFEAAFEEEVKSDQEIPPQAADCIIERFKDFSDQEAQEFLIQPDASGGEEVFTPCFQQ